MRSKTHMARATKYDSVAVDEEQNAAEAPVVKGSRLRMLWVTIFCVLTGFVGGAFAGRSPPL